MRKPIISGSGGEPKRSKNKEATLRTLAMPADANVIGYIFGGWVLSQMDLAGGIAAGQLASSLVVTVAVDAMKFIRPVHIGDVLCVYADIVRVGRSSIAVQLECHVLRGRFGAKEKVTEAIYTFVALDDDLQPKDINLCCFTG